MGAKQPRTTLPRSPGSLGHPVALLPNFTAQGVLDPRDKGLPVGVLFNSWSRNSNDALNSLTLGIMHHSPNPSARSAYFRRMSPPPPSLGRPLYLRAPRVPRSYVTRLTGPPRTPPPESKYPGRLAGAQHCAGLPPPPAPRNTFGTTSAPLATTLTGPPRSPPPESKYSGRT